jgi:hypothetical protein
VGLGKFVGFFVVRLIWFRIELLSVFMYWSSIRRSLARIFFILPCRCIYIYIYYVQKACHIYTIFISYSEGMCIFLILPLKKVIFTILISCPEDIYIFFITFSLKENLFVINYM